MIKALLAFVVLFTLVYFGIELFRKMTGKQKWALTKTVTYSIVCGVLALLALTAIVVLF